ncbi:MAG TPA: hypothetical protein DDW76_10175 [Cyanobacteria bacterium UBA11369]|nr:hypothetical protein [Cyanobacteria bacterium UBA11371]HBE34643.1 hypothetical protein [Cyanobacteria bacterium UBA11368]HBE49140.1 hypothetical protein [Cyanobacteria bacterium UBA11369]
MLAIAVALNWRSLLSFLAGIYVGWKLLCVLLRVRRALLSPSDNTEQPENSEIYGFKLLCN